jgi:hypothetical protein
MHDERHCTTKKAGAPPAPALCFGSVKNVRQQVALPQRAIPIFSFKPSSPTAPTTICLPMT